MWIGGPGSTTQAHYDVSHNLFTQLHGSKRFRLWGPQYHWGKIGQCYCMTKPDLQSVLLPGADDRHHVLRVSRAVGDV